MSTILLTTHTTPAATTTSKVRFYVDSADGVLKSIDTNALVVNYNVSNAVIVAALTGTSHTVLSDKGTNTHAQIDTHISNTSNPHSVTKTQVGLSNVDNTTDLNKPISTATQAALDLKASINLSIINAIIFS